FYTPVFVFLFYEPVTAWLYSFMLAVMVGVVALLRSRRPLSLGQLRWIELVIFGGAALVSTRAQWKFFTWDWLARIADDDWLALMLVARGMSFAWLILIAAYGLLIPNTARRCAAVVGVLALWPGLLNAALALPDP